MPSVRPRRKRQALAFELRQNNADFYARTTNTAFPCQGNLTSLTA